MILERIRWDHEAIVPTEIEGIGVVHFLTNFAPQWPPRSQALTLDLSMDIGYTFVFIGLESRHCFFFNVGLSSMYKKKLQNEATCVRPLYLLLLTAATLCSPHFLLCTKTSHLPYQIQLPSASFISRPRHSLPSRFMPASYLSVICSSFAVCITTIKSAVPAQRLYYEYTRKPKPFPELKLQLDAGMSAIFAILSWLLLAFSLTRLQNGLQIVLSSAEGLTIVYQVGCLILLRNFC